VVVSVASSEVLSVGRVPSQHCPTGAVRAEDETDLMWAIRGAGTNIGIVVSVTFKAYPAPVYSVRNWVIPLSDSFEAQLKLSDLDDVARELPRNCSVDPYLYWDTELRLGLTMYQSSTANLNLEATEVTPTPVEAFLGPGNGPKTVDGVGLFETEMYISGLHGGHSGGKTSSFKRCVFLNRIGDVTEILVAAVENRPSPFCYLHLLQGGGAVGDITNNATAFGCRDWDYACVITGVWSRDQDGTEVARKAVEWVYTVATNLLPLSSGAYGADLGPDPRDAALAAMAFGGNLARLARLKHTFDPSNVLAYSCPLPKAPTTPKLIVLVTGEHGAGKDHSAGIFETICSQKGLSARVVSISDATKWEYAETTGADLECLLHDRAYKEQHRPELTAYFEEQVRQRPQLPEENFANVVHSAGDVDVLFITGMRDEAPVATFSHLVPDSRLLEVRIEASSETRRARRMFQGSKDAADDDVGNDNGRDSNSRPSLIFHNDTTGDGAAKEFCEDNLFPFFYEDLNRLTDMVRLVPNFPAPGIEFRDILAISQQSGGLALCTSLLQTHFTGDWSKVNAIACCETGGFVFASALALRVDVPLALIRETGRLPPPTISVVKSASHITSSGSSDSVEKKIEIGRSVISRGLVVVDDVLATGKTLCAVLQLLAKAGIDAEDIDVLVVAEFPVHCGRKFLQHHGFGGINIQSLLVFGGA
jgi:adenine phosphoribosyltransferase/phosphomevalonate kinase